MTTNIAHLNKTAIFRKNIDYWPRSIFITFNFILSLKVCHNCLFPTYTFILYTIHPHTPEIACESFQDYRCLSICSCRMGEQHQYMASGDKKYVCHQRTSEYVK